MRPTSPGSAVPALLPLAVHVTLGVDTHADVHVAAALDPVGRLLGTCTVPTTAGGYAALVAWAHRHGALQLSLIHI